MPPSRYESAVETSSAGLALEFALLAVLGLGLETAYRPSAALAHASIEAIQASPVLRWVMASHHWGAAVLFLHAGGQLSFQLWSGSYGRAFRRSWFLALGMALAGAGFLVTGNLLPFDRHGVQTAMIESSVASRVPVAGHAVAGLMRGGPLFTGGALPAWHGFHAIALPLLGLTAIALWLAGKPRPRWRLAFVPVVLVAMLALVPVPTGSAATAADLATYDARPGWYVWPMHGLLDAFSRIDPSLGWVGSALAPALLVGFLASLALFSKFWTVARVRGTTICAALLIAATTILYGGSPAPILGNRDPVGGGASEASGKVSIPVDAVLAARGRTLFNSMPCAGCHGKNARGTEDAPNLFDPRRRHFD
ncbi:MAG: cytochrome b N-terminal domain-containing protein, partial [Fimbriimonas ginsengisoli]|nr:cytochrome b N-terminal domain-containing protein [Fimbriimonas ginsengisoli]